jgi:hypothetical protein
MPQVSFEFLQIASLSRRRHGFDSRTGRQTYQSFTKKALVLDQFMKSLPFGVSATDPPIYFLMA